MAVTSATATTAAVPAATAATTAPSITAAAARKNVRRAEQASPAPSRGPALKVCAS